MAFIERFEEIVSWKEVRELNKKIGGLIDNGRFKSGYHLIAEGFERGGNKEFVQFLYIAKGSCSDLRSQRCRAPDRKYITHEEFQ